MPDNSFVINEITSQNPFEENISFPSILESVLTTEDYLEYFSRLENLLVKSKTNPKSLTLKKASKEALLAFQTYLSKNPELKFKELSLETTSEEDAKLLPDLVSNAAKAGLEALNLTAINITLDTATKILTVIKEQNLVIDIILPTKPEFLKIQLAMDNDVADFQRKKRIENFASKSDENLKAKAKPKNLPKRKRNIPHTKKIDIDTEIQVQVAIEKSESNVIELEDQFEDKNFFELIDRDKFVELVKEDKFETKIPEEIKKNSRANWDCWLGNISQTGLKESDAVKIFVGADENAITTLLLKYPKDTHAYYIFLKQPIPNSYPTEMMACTFTKYSQGYNASYHYYYKENLEEFIDEFYSDVKDDKYPLKELTIQDWIKWRPPSAARLPLTSTAEKWKGEFIVDANSLESPEENSLEDLIKKSPIKFDKPELIQRFYPNPKIPMMTKEACEILIAHASQLKFGLDFEHLPAGFELREIKHSGKLITVLDYSKLKAKTSKNDPLAIKFIQPEILPILSTEELNHALSLDSTQAKKLKLIYETLLEPYDREKVKKFRQYLPLMFYVPEASLSSFETSIQAALNIEKDLDNKKVDIKKHLLYKLLKHFKEDEEGLAVLEPWLKNLNLSVADLNKILGVYTEFGLKGLKRLSQNWESLIKSPFDENIDYSRLKNLKKIYFPHCKTFISFLNPEFELALKQLKQLDKAEYQFWELLFSQHCEAVGYDKLANLVESFSEFKAIITKTYKLSFPADLEAIAIKSLPITISRILSILAATPACDREEVWKDLLKLDLSSTGAIKVIADAELKPEGGVLLTPEEQMEVTNYITEHDYSSKGWKPEDKLVDHGYHSFKITHEEQKNSLLNDFTSLYYFEDKDTSNYLELFGLCKDKTELNRNYYRFLATLPYRKPLAFYRNASTMIHNKFSNLTIASVFHALIAGSASTFETSLKEETQAQSEKRIKRILSVFDKIQGIPEFFKIAVSKVIANVFSPPPPLEYLDKLFRILQPALKFSPTDLLHVQNTNARFDKIKDALEQIGHTTTGKNKLGFYEGIRFFDFDSMTLDEFCEICDLSFLISSIGAYNLTSLISTFKLNKESFAQIENFSNVEFDPTLNKCAKILTHLNPGTPSVLSPQDLIDLLSRVKTEFKKHSSISDESLVALIKEKFGKYFEEGYLENIAKPGLSTKLVKLIQANFTKSEDEILVRSLLESFTQLEEFELQKFIIKSLAKICASLSEEDKKSFLEKMAIKSAHKNSSLQELSELLIAIAERGSVDSFIFIMNFYKTTPPLSLVLTYYKQALPLIYANKPEHLTISELQILAANLLVYKNISDFPKEFKEILSGLDNLSTRFPNEKPLILALLRNFLTLPKPETAAKLDYEPSKFIFYLINLDGNILRSLSEHYLSNPFELYALFSKLEELSVKEKQTEILTMVSSLANNGKETSIATVSDFVKKADSQKDFYAQAEACFETPPYPEIELLLDWHQQSEGDKYTETFEKLYRNHQKNPCEREEENGFQKARDEHYAKKFEGVEFTEEELMELETAISAAKSKDIKTLKEDLTKNLSTIDRIATLAELLYLSKGREGNSFEINAVQYLSLLAYLKTGGHITAEMGTGEGKSRTMMLALACQASQGKTVDFITADMQLAERDFLEYQAFFKMIKVKTSLIYSASAPENYQIGGINFSDASNLSLFRNKARSSRRAKKVIKVIDENPHNRVLVLDEADKTYFDVSETRYNFSDLPKSAELKDMEWVYPVLIRFFLQKGREGKLIAELFENDIDACNEAFLNFAEIHEGISEEMMIRLKRVPLSQLETWQESAMIALSLKLGEDYTIEPNVLIETAKGPKLVSVARLIYGNRIAPNSKFSFGVHQCLHALLNEELKNEASATFLKAKELMAKQGKLGKAMGFHIEAEKQIIYSSTSKSLLDEYKDGDVWGITGTAGAIIEREEAALLYSKADAGSLMKFMTVPRRVEPKRIDRPIHLTKNFDKRVEAIYEYILEAQNAGRPVLVIAENDNEAEKIHQALVRLSKGAITEENCSLVNALTTTEEEKAAIDKAGLPKMITISTKRLGRGTDIQLGGKKIEVAKEVTQAGGLRVIGTYLPRDRDLDQIFGRAGRYGAPGDARLVVDKFQLRKTFKSKSIRQGFFLATDFFIKSQQAEEDKRQQVERLLRTVLSDFRVKITDAFFKYYDDPKLVIPATARDDWTNCTRAMDQHWAKAWPDLQEELAKPKINIEKINARLDAFKADAQKEWSKLNTKLGGALEAEKDLDNIVINPITKHLLKAITPKRLYKATDRTQVYKAYEKALDGRAVIYDEIFMGLKSVYRGEREIFANTKAFLAGTGIIFADSRALLTGKRPLFANLRAYMAKSQKQKVELNSKCKTILKALEQESNADLKRLLRKEDARSLINPVRGDVYLTMKIELVEKLLSYMHKKYESGSEISAANMTAIRELLINISELKKIEELKPLKGGFFSHSLKREFKSIISEHKPKI